ncbi:MAG: phenylalanine--tRNA ligase subunit beta [Desulfuromonadales bacterium]|nr:phenylalanine--tRNA ligase subunit beta [Desulfuromonadales bacterium]
MKVSYNWLKEYVKFDLSPNALANLLTMLGLEVEGIEHIGEEFDTVVVAIVEERLQHPNADKLSLCKVNNGREILSIVCGAQNFKSGDKVALAQVGTVLPGDFKIKKSKIRGEESCGMLCSEKELGLTEESDGIIVLPDNSKIGTPLFESMGLKDTIFELGLTPNRADCLSVIGVAREIGAKLGLKLEYPTIVVKESDRDINQIASIKIEAPDLCPRYTARYVSGCKIGPSPQWLVNRLNAVGYRSINNVVDITNYVLMEYGHPLHAFDFRMLKGGQIIVKTAAQGEKFVTLDAEERELTTSDLTIRDSLDAVALAGVMGGENSEIKQDTTDILIESAYFNPSAIRKTSKRLGLHTESSHRFERGTDINILTTALDRAAFLVAELAGGEIAKGIIDNYPSPISDKKVDLRVDRVNSLLGTELKAEEIANILKNLGFSLKETEKDSFSVDIPSFRVDIEREVDLIEEVARLHGYNNIPATMPLARVISDITPPAQTLGQELKNHFVGIGFNEVINFSFGSCEEIKKLKLADNDKRVAAIALINPIVDEHSVMRTSLLPGLLQTVSKNVNMRSETLRLFEMRRVYHLNPGETAPSEPLYIAGVMTGTRFSESWNQSKELVDFFDIKGVVESVVNRFKLPSVSYSSENTDPFYHPGKSALLKSDDQIIGTFGEIHPDVQESFGLDKPVQYFELDFGAIMTINNNTAPIKAPSRYPDTFRDIAMLVKKGIAADKILSVINSARIPNLTKAYVFDLYEGDKIPEGEKSIAVRVRYGSSERTLTDEEVNKFHQKVINSLQAQLEMVIR